MNATDVRTELGARFDDPTLLYGKPLILYGRARLGARLCQQSRAKRRPSKRCRAAGFTVIRRADPARTLRSLPRVRNCSSSAELVADRQVRRRVCAGLADLRRFRNIALYVVNHRALAACSSTKAGRRHFSSPERRGNGNDLVGVDPVAV